MVHPKIKPDDQVLLFQTFAVEEVVEIDRRVVYILTIEPVSAFGLGILALCDVEVVLGPTCRIDQITAVLHRQVCQACVRQD